MISAALWISQSAFLLLKRCRQAAAEWILGGFVGVLVISAALQMSVAGAKVKSASLLLSVTLPTRARSLLPHTRLRLLGVEVRSPACLAAMGLPEEGNPLLQELCHLWGPTNTAPPSLPCVGQQGEGAALCSWETQGTFQEEGTSSWLCAGSIPAGSQAAAGLVYHPHVSGEGAQPDLITCKTPAQASIDLGLPRFRQNSTHIISSHSVTLTKHWTSPLLTPFCHDPLSCHSQREITEYPPRYGMVVSISP